MNDLLTARTFSAALAAALAPQPLEKVMRVRGEVRLGVPVVLTDQGQSALVIAAEMLTADRFAALVAGPGRVVLALTGQRAAALGWAALPDGSDTGAVTITVPPGADMAWVMALADPAKAATPGVVGGDGPLAARSLAPVFGPGHRLCRAALALAKAAQVLPAALVVPLDAQALADLPPDLCRIDAAEVLTALGAARVQHHVSSAFLPMTVHQAGRVHVFRPDDGSIEHYAIEIGTPDLRRPVLVRLHSACFTGDVMGSLKCDCGPQLHAATAAMAAAGGGVLLYMNQEGRGIGMANKMRAYALQDRGLDTVEANHHLGFADDERDFRQGAALLHRMGIAAVRLLTNNPAKVAILQAQGITVTERVALQVGKTAQNARYLATKAAKSGHVMT